jgi:hypothetical protein
MRNSLCHKSMQCVTGEESNSYGVKGIVTCLMAYETEARVRAVK